MDQGLENILGVINASEDCRKRIDKADSLMRVALSFNAFSENEFSEILLARVDWEIQQLTWQILTRHGKKTAELLKKAAGAAHKAVDDINDVLIDIFGTAVTAKQLDEISQIADRLDQLSTELNMEVEQRSKRLIPLTQGRQSIA
jgi:hypothetical protein